MKVNSMGFGVDNSFEVYLASVSMVTLSQFLPACHAVNKQKGEF